MRRRFPALGWLLLLFWAGPATPASADERPSLAADLGIGEAPAGREISILPASYREGEVGEPLAASGFDAYLVLDSDPSVERVFPCGAWLQLPPRSSARIWVAGEGLISPFSYSASAIEDRLRQRVVSLPVVPAGRVALPQALAEPQQMLWLLSLEPRSDGGKLRSELSRHRPVAEAGAGVLMPSGLAVAAIWDPRRRSYVALSRPFEVRAGETVEAPLEPPGPKANLLVEIDRSSVALTGEGDRLELTVAPNSAPLAGVAVSTAWRLYGLWYDLEPQTMRLSVASAEDLLTPPLVFDVLPGRVERLAATLDPRPALEVEVILPASMDEEEVTLELRSLPDGQAIGSKTLGRGARSHRFARLVPQLLAVELETRFGKFSEQVDLSDGEPDYVLLEPDWIVISGTVFHGERPHPAKLTFLTVDKETVEAWAGPDGKYEAVSLVPLRHVTVTLDGIEAAPYVDFFLEALARSAADVDFHLPDVELTVKVLDAASGKGIPDAAVTVRNQFRPKAGEGRGSRHDKAIVQRSVADREGVALLPPLRPGSVELRASAPGYFHMRDPLIEEVREEEQDRAFEILLEPVGSQVGVRLKLPNGQPAAGAEVLLADSVASAEALFSAQADENGLVPISRGARGVLLIRHPAAAFLVRDWQPERADDEMEWALPRASPRPLTVLVKDPWGERASPRAWLAIWVDGRRLSGLPLSWLTGARPAADNNGFWTAGNLPESAVSVLAWPARNRGAGEAGLLDSLATDIAFPWPDLVEVSASE